MRLRDLAVYAKACGPDTR
jgi:hypothetical protein